MLGDLLPLLLALDSSLERAGDSLVAAGDTAPTRRELHLKVTNNMMNDEKSRRPLLTTPDSSLEGASDNLFAVGDAAPTRAESYCRTQ